MVNPGKMWSDVVNPGKMWSDVVNPAKMWSDVVNPCAPVVKTYLSKRFEIWREMWFNVVKFG